MIKKIPKAIQNLLKRRGAHEVVTLTRVSSSHSGESVYVSVNGTEVGALIRVNRDPNSKDYEDAHRPWSVWHHTADGKAGRKIGSEHDEWAGVRRIVEHGKKAVEVTA